MDELGVVLGSFFGSQVRNDGAWHHTVVRSDEGFFTTRVRTHPTAELFVTPRPLDGFTLTLRGERIRPDATFDTALTISTNDHELARHWLDTVARTAVLDSAFDYHSADTSSDIIGLGVGDPFYRPPGMVVRRIWTYELANDELIATKGTVEPQAERIALALTTACTIASRCRRWAAEYAPIARRIGAESRSEIELGGAPVITS
ncbi:MAG: hypothetical protein H0V17_28860, partial [Deltaproteobacteria bacterium]|nr:hypothetical protein [Deltaproteobacteria bacterium]